MEDTREIEKDDKVVSGIMRWLGIALIILPVLGFLLFGGKEDPLAYFGGVTIFAFAAGLAFVLSGVILVLMSKRR